MFNTHLTPRELYLALRDRQGEGPVRDQKGGPAQEPATPPSPGAARPLIPATPAKEPPTAAPEERSQTQTVFAVVSPTFGRATQRPIERVVPLLPAAPPPRPTDQEVPVPPPHPVRPNPTVAYQPVHAACVALLHAIERLSAQYGQEWLQWEQAQADLTQLRAALALA